MKTKQDKKRDSILFYEKTRNKIISNKTFKMEISPIQPSTIILKSLTEHFLPLLWKFWWIVPGESSQ